MKPDLHLPVIPERHRWKIVRHGPCFFVSLQRKWVIFWLTIYREGTYVTDLDEATRKIETEAARINRRFQERQFIRSLTGAYELRADTTSKKAS